MLLFHQTDQIFLNSILTWSQLSLQILALKNSIDWSKATFEVVIEILLILFSKNNKIKIINEMSIEL